MRTMTTPAIIQTATASLWDTPVPVAPPKPAMPPAPVAAADFVPPFDVPDEPVAEVKAEPLPVKEIEAIAATVGPIFSTPGSNEPFDPILFLKEHKLLDPIYAAHRSIIESEHRELELENELTDLRFELASLRDAKREMLEALPVQLFAIRTGLAPSTVVPKSPKPESTHTAPTVADNAWRAVLTNTITKGVVGLGVKKAESLVDEFPTLGDLCDAMARATAAHRHFADELPKGIGKQSADELANRVMAAQTRGDTRPASEVVEPRKNLTAPDVADKSHERFVRMTLANQSHEATESSLRENRGESWDEGYEAAADGQPALDCQAELQQDHQIDWIRGWLCYDMFHRDAEKADELANRVMESQTNDDLANMLHADFVTDTVDWLIANPSEQSVDCASNREMWQVGYDAGTEGVEPTECPTEVAHTSEELAITEAMQVDWLRGMVASTRAESPSTDAATPDEPDTAEPKTGGAVDLDAIVKQVKSAPDRKYRDSQAAWETGYEAAVDQQPVESIPTDLSAGEMTDWVRGWVFGGEIDFDL